MESNLISTVFLPLALAIIMLNLGIVMFITAGIFISMLNRKKLPYNKPDIFKV